MSTAYPSLGGETSRVALSRNNEQQSIPETQGSGNEKQQKTGFNNP